jgi:hypothetical protein
MVALTTTQTNHHFDHSTGKMLSEDESQCACQEKRNE